MISGSYPLRNWVTHPSRDLSIQSLTWRSLPQHCHSFPWISQVWGGGIQWGDKVRHTVDGLLGTISLNLTVVPSTVEMSWTLCFKVPVVQESFPPFRCYSPAFLHCAMVKRWISTSQQRDDYRPEVDIQGEIQKKPIDSSTTFHDGLDQSIWRRGFTNSHCTVYPIGWPYCIYIQWSGWVVLYLNSLRF